VRESRSRLNFWVFRWRRVSQKNIKKPAELQFSEAAHLIEGENDADDVAWATRSSMWRARVEKASTRHTKRAKPKPGLILAGHGVSLRIENGALTIQNGFTHYPQQREMIRYFRGDVALPERIIFIGRQRQHFLRCPVLARRAKSRTYSN
jgi:hypothetical protein